ncbi:hypothetical protein BON30_15285 [Cystobacter ferrugineus]|uniref:Uncharacterized protein n=1 Tax=Cystobacter ferrugineus TaxID=83449 RepID=A0A1L9BDT2_9BACT|nr:hypothetical protein BON30_15285 [Cystobacter ferrugineus]
MAWHPRLVVRFDRGRCITSPTNSVGYGVQGILAAFVACGLVVVAASGESLVLLVLAVPGVFLRDAWAWFAATEEERASFRTEAETEAHPCDHRTISLS